MNRYTTFVMYLALLISNCWTFETQNNRDRCNYSYDKVPANSTCNIMVEGGLAAIGCEATGICNTFTVLWFKHTIENRIIINGSEHGSKYQVLTTGSQFVADCRCRIGTTLNIHRFNHSDNGYYSCQIDLTVSDNSHLLRSSPRGYVAVGETTNERPMTCIFEHQLATPMCAEDSTVSEEIRCTSESLSSAVNIVPTDMLGPYSTHIYNTNSTSTAAVTSMVILLETPFDRQQNMVWVYGLMIVFLFAIIVLVLSLVLVSIKRRTQQKPPSSNHHSKYRLAQEEVSNPHYVKTSLADNNVCANNEEPSTLSNTQSQTSENEERSQSAENAKESNTGDNTMYQFASYNQDKIIDYSHEPPGYAAVNTAKHGNLRIEKSVQNSIGDEWFSPGYDEVGGHEVASKTVHVVMVKEQEDASPYKEPQQRCPSPVYAEVHKDKKKKQQQDCSVLDTEEREGNQSPEYSQVENINKHYVNQTNQEDEQHYYHSLENPVELGNKEIVYTSKYSQEPQVVSIQRILCESSDPDVTNTHTEITDSDSEVNTFPNPCYHTQRHTAD